MSEIEQGSDNWFAARLGKATASRIADIVARTKTGASASRANYAAQLVCERLTNGREAGFSSAAMQWGTDHEPDARAAYSFRMDIDVEEVGFVDHPTISFSGASPDGLVGEEGLLEIKCPNTATHIDTLLNGTIPGKYVDQMQWQMACTGRQWCDFASYDPRMPEAMRLYVQRIQRDGDRIKHLETEVIDFLDGVEATVARLCSIYAAPANDEWRTNILLAG
jgi:putative phage-type endonuclease